MWVMVSATAQLLLSFLLNAFTAEAEHGDIPSVILHQMVLKFPNYLRTLLLCKCYSNKSIKIYHEEVQYVMPTKELVLTSLIESNAFSDKININESEAAIAATKRGSELEIKNVDSPSGCNIQLLASRYVHKATECEESQLTPPKEGWDEIAGALNWVTDVAFVAFNVILCIKYNRPLFICQLASSFSTNYLIDEAGM